LVLNKAIFLDRDGVVNKPLFKKNRKNHPFAPNRVEDFILYHDVIKFVKKIQSKYKYKVFIITNQPDLSRGDLSINILNEMHKKLYDNLKYDGIEFCGHLSIDNCKCRKPEPGMIKKIEKKNNIDLKKSFFIGDTWRDIFCGMSAGIRTYLINRHYNKDFYCDSRISKLNDLTKIIFDLEKSNG